MYSSVIGMHTAYLYMPAKHYLVRACKIPINNYWSSRFFFITLQVVIAHIITNR